MIFREMIGFGALTVSAFVPLWTARVVLGGIVAFLQHQRKDRNAPHP